ncbi:DUF2076 domain-containing protein [Chelativorans sp. J32]|uniref:DUF2076 domain-containing protein n=1 Tax=Chelativorans sp. J32 TaxID=935840 RepID=UPI00048967F7|nr:DUF2076 domain-containing protein [Chelativorans sp. J32]
MDRNDQQAIESLFEKLADVERQSPARDDEAEAFIREQIARQPGAPYYMAQTIVVQEQALNAAQARIEELERQAQSRQSAGGLFSGIFGDSRRPSRPSGSVPRIGRPGAAPQPFSAAPQRAGGGFLAGAAQTAMGVAGGVLLGNMIAGMLDGGGQAEAAEPAADSLEAEDASFDDAGFDGGDDFEI